VPRQKQPITLPRISSPPLSTPLPPSTPRAGSPEDSPSWPSISSDSPQKGLTFFRGRKSNILNFVSNLDAEWKEVFRGSDILSWKRKFNKKAVNLLIIGRLVKWNLLSAHSDFEPSYRVELDLDHDTVTSLRALLDSGPLGDTDDTHYPIVGHSAIFSAKLKALQKTDAPYLNAENPFPFLFDGTELDGLEETPLVVFPAEQLTTACQLAIETNISTYTIPPRGQFLGRIGYSMSLRLAYVVATTDIGSSGLVESSPMNRKRPGEVLVSPRRNKQAGQPAVFSDEE
jgi:hypothetical protein